MDVFNNYYVSTEHINDQKMIFPIRDCRGRKPGLSEKSPMIFWFEVWLFPNPFTLLGDNVVLEHTGHTDHLLSVVLHPSCVGNPTKFLKRQYAYLSMVYMAKYLYVLFTVWSQAGQKRSRTEMFR